MKNLTTGDKWRAKRVAGCCRFILGGLLITFLSAGCAGMITKADSISPIKGRLAELRVSQPGPNWNSVVHAIEVDVLVPVGEDKVLVGTLSSPGFVSSLSVTYLEFMLLDNKNGKIMWTYPRSSMGGLSQTVLTVDPVILVNVNYRNKNKYCVLNRQTGKLMWEREVKASANFLLIPSMDMIVISEASGSSLDVYGINIADGKDSWKQEIMKYNPSKNESLNLLTSGDALIVLGKEVLGLSLKGGSILWRAPYLGTYGDAVISSLQEDGLFLTDGKKTCLLNIKSGAVIWETQETEGSIKHVNAVGRSVFVIARITDGEASHDIVRALGRKSGTVIWSRPLEERILSPLFAGANGLYFSSRTRLYSLDLPTGRPRFLTVFPTSLVAENSLPDVLSEYDQKIIVARETGVIAFSADKGILLFSEQVTGGRSFTHHYNMNRIVEVAQIAAGPKKAPLVLANMQIAQNTGYFRMAQEHQRAVYARTEQVITGRTTTSSERMSAYRDRITATDRSISAKRMQMQSDKTQAGLELANAIAGSLGSIGAALSQQTFETLFTNMNMRLSKSILDHSNSLHYEAGLYVRPFYNDGLNLAMVDLKTGKRADILLSPAIEPLRLFSAQTIKLPAFAVDQTGTKLIVKGLGLQESQYETYEMITWGCGTSRRNVKNWTIPYPSILSYDISEIFSAAKQTGGTTPGKMISEEEKTMITAAFNGDEAVVKKVLEQGANVNAIDEDGHTAFIHATLALKHDIMELLLKNGADGNIEDDDCWSAEHYLQFPSLAGVASLSTLMKVERSLENARKKHEK